MRTRLKVGQIASDHGDEWEVLELIEEDPLRVRVRVNAVNLFASYLDVGSEYTAFQHSSFVKNDETWEIPGEQMKRRVSQVLMFYFGDDQHPCFELDM
jgi:uncharacterized protein YchJ